MQRSCLSLSTSLFALAQTTLLALVFLTIASVGASAQIDRAELEGTVNDASGAVIRGAKVQVLAANTGVSQEQQTNSNGYYRFPGLAVGRYTVTVTGTGFKTHVIEQVVVQVGQTRTLDIKLAVGAVAEKVEVKASDEPENRASAEASTVIREDQVANLPNNGRD